MPSRASLTMGPLGKIIMLCLSLSAGAQGGKGLVSKSSVGVVVV